MNFTLDGLDAFVAFSESLNFTRAAAVLRISQPALHVKIRKLADDLGVVLYTKRGRELVLTEQGREVARFGRELCSTREAFIDELHERQSRRTVTLAAGQGALLYLLGDALARFRRRAAGALRLIPADRQRTLDLLVTGEAQLGVTVLAAVPEWAEAKLIHTSPALWVVPTAHGLAHRLARRRSVSVRELENADLILPPEGTPHRTAIAALLDAHRVAWNVAVEATGWELILHLVKLGLGTAIVNGCCRLPKGVTGIQLQEFPATRYYLIWRRGAVLAPAHQALADLIVESGRPAAHGP